MGNFTQTRAKLASLSRDLPADDPKLMKVRRDMTAISIDIQIDKYLAKSCGISRDDASKLIDKLLAAIVDD